MTVDQFLRIGCERLPPLQRERLPLDPASDVCGVPGSDDCYAVKLDGHIIGMAVWDSHARAFHAVNDRNERLPGSYDDEHSAADAVLDAREDTICPTDKPRNVRTERKLAAGSDEEDSRLRKVVESLDADRDEGDERFPYENQ